MEANSSSEELDLDLLQQLERILDHDKHIDEVGLLHPTQLAELNEGSNVDIVNEGTKELHRPQYNRAIFWSNNHKLAISIEVLPQLYNAAYRAYLGLIRSYKQSIGSSLNKENFDNALCEAEILNHTRVLLILSYDFISAWNSRKLVLSRKQDLSLFLDELQLSTFILSYAPKSDSAWSQRRWAIKMIADKHHDLYELIGKESELVKNIAEKSKMNYRAWNHRCWLVPYMEKSQVADELNKSRKWAELHVADNCCFHYRRRLMLIILEGRVKESGDISCNHISTVHSLWKEELRWNNKLIRCYIGREALWIHRRFLSQCWVKNLMQDDAFDDFLCEELELLYACIDTSYDEFDDGQSQAKHATSYILWILKQMDSSQGIKLHERLREVGGLVALLTKNCPERVPLWEKILG